MNKIEKDKLKRRYKVNLTWNIIMTGVFFIVFLFLIFIAPNIFSEASEHMKLLTIVFLLFPLSIGFYFFYKINMISIELDFYRKELFRRRSEIHFNLFLSALKDKKNLNLAEQIIRNSSMTDIAKLVAGGILLGIKLQNELNLNIEGVFEWDTSTNNS